MSLSSRRTLPHPVSCLHPPSASSAVRLYSVPHRINPNSRHYLIDWSSTEPAVEEHIEDVFTAVGGGYGESKFVAEHILHRASKETPLQPIVVRIGQLSGGKNGSWNVAEWLPSVVRSGEVVGCLPASDDVSPFSLSAILG